MKFKLVLLTTLLIVSGTAIGQTTDDDEMEATMRLMGNAEAELPDAVIKTIELPESLLKRDPESPAVEASANGHAKAAERHARREAGLDQAELARERSEEMSQKANDNRESLGRGERPEPPENPGPSDNRPNN